MISYYYIHLAYTLHPGIGIFQVWLSVWECLALAS